MRILVTSTAGTGHIHPVVPLALAAQRAGHDVRWAVAESSRSAVERVGIPTVAAGIGVGERIAAFGEQFGAAVAAVPPPERRALAFTGHFARLCAPRMLDDLRPVVNEWRPDVIVHETAELAGPLLAEAGDIPHATVAFSGALPASAVASAADALTPLRQALGLAPTDDLGLARHAYFHPFPASMGQRPDSAMVHELRPGGEDGAGASEQPEWVAALGRERPLAYVTFGTEMGPLAPWPVLMPVLGALDELDVVVTIGGALDPAVLGQVPAHVRVERYVPQGWLLPRCSLVVSHAGAGTLLAAAAHGIPHLLLPIGADQFENTAALVATGAGVSGFGLDATGLDATVRDLLADDARRDAAGRLAAEIAAMPDADAAVEVLERLAG